MVKVTGPIFSVDAKGTLGGAITYQGGSGKHRVIRVPTHKDAGSGDQLTQRALFLGAAARWHLLGAEDKADYEVFGVVYHMTGYNWHMKLYLSGLIPPGNSGFPYIFTFTLV